MPYSRKLQKKDKLVELSELYPTSFEKDFNNLLGKHLFNSNKREKSTITDNSFLLNLPSSNINNTNNGKKFPDNKFSPSPKKFNTDIALKPNDSDKIISKVIIIPDYLKSRRNFAQISSFTHCTKKEAIHIPNLRKNNKTTLMMKPKFTMQ